MRAIRVFHRLFQIRVHWCPFVVEACSPRLRVNSQPADCLAPAAGLWFTLDAPDARLGTHVLEAASRIAAVPRLWRGNSTIRWRAPFTLKLRKCFVML